MPRLMRHHARAAVPADIVERPHLPVMAADDQGPLADHVEALVVARLRNVVHMAGKLPALAEQLPALQLQELGVEIGPGWQPAALAVGKLHIDIANVLHEWASIN